MIIIKKSYVEHNNSPLLVSNTISALFGRPSQDGVWVSASFSIHCKNCSRLQLERLKHFTSIEFLEKILKFKLKDSDSQGCINT